jgi:hypothetical protein
MVPRMRATFRATAFAVFGAAAGALFLLGFHRTHAAIAFEMERDLPAITSGFHPLEREGERSFVWTSDRAVVRLAGLDRDVEWACRVHARAPRPAGHPPAALRMSYDGTGGGEFPLGNEYGDAAIVIPARTGRPGLTLTLTVAPTFVPGGGDPRTLGAQVDRLVCEPATAAWPPAAAWQGVVAVGVFGLALGIVAAPLTLAAVVLLAVAGGLAWLLSIQAGAFGTYPSLASWAIIGAAGTLAAGASLPRLWGRARLSATALAALTLTCAFAALKLAALAHPAKATVDALFQAHRLDWVLAGRYFFTQPLPDGVVFPYAIGLYVIAAPWAALVTDHVLLLRIVVVAADAAAGLFLYALVARGLADRAAGVIAVALFHLAPIPFVVVGNGNLTNAFAQSAALMAVACAMLVVPASRRRDGIVGTLVVASLTALAFLSHVSTVMLLAATLGVIAGGLFIFGDRALRGAAIRLAVAATIAAIAAVALYYRHFGDVFAEFVSRVGAVSADATATAEDAGSPAILARQLTLYERSAAGARETAASIGWMLLVLSGAGLWRLVREGWRRPGSLFVLGWTLAWAGLLAWATLTRVDTQYQRYALELVGRINLACYPLAAALAGLGAVKLWRTRHPVARALVLLCVLAAVAAGADMWRGWTA